MTGLLLVSGYAVTDYLQLTTAGAASVAEPDRSGIALERRLIAGNPAGRRPPVAQRGGVARRGVGVGGGGPAVRRAPGANCRRTVHSPHSPSRESGRGPGPVQLMARTAWRTTGADRLLIRATGAVRPGRRLVLT
jgi:hypothetical protein